VEGMSWLSNLALVQKYYPQQLSPFDNGPFSVIILLLFALVKAHEHTWWPYLLSLASPPALFYVGSFLISKAVFWGLSTLLLYLETSELWWTKLREYKIQKNVRSDTASFKKAARMVIWCQVVVEIPTALMFYPMWVSRGGGARQDLPSPQELFGHLLVCGIIEEIGNT
jgi:hypothetical protein